MSSGDASLSSSSTEKRKSIEDMTKEELIELFKKVRAQTATIANDKKAVEEQLEASISERDNVKLKTRQLLDKYKQLEEKLKESTVQWDNKEKEYKSQLESFPHSSSTTGDLLSFEEDEKGSNAMQDLKEQLEHANNEVQRYKNGAEKIMLRLKDVKVSLDTKTLDCERLASECENLNAKVLVLESNSFANVVAYQTEIEKYKRLHENHERMLSENNQVIQRLKLDLAKAEKESIDLNFSAMTMRNDLDRVKQENADQAQLMVNTEKSLRAEIADLSLKYQEQSQQLDYKKCYISSEAVNAQLAAFSEEIISLQTKVSLV